MIDRHQPRVATFLRASPEVVCAKCIAMALDIRLNAAQHVAALLEGTRSFARGSTRCAASAACGV
jgi:hypothetical protein